MPAGLNSLGRALMVRFFYYVSLLLYRDSYWLILYILLDYMYGQEQRRTAPITHQWTGLEMHLHLESQVFSLLPTPGTTTEEQGLRCKCVSSPVYVFFKFSLLLVTNNLWLDYLYRNYNNNNEQPQRLPVLPHKRGAMDRGGEHEGDNRAAGGWNAMLLVRFFVLFLYNQLTPTKGNNNRGSSPWCFFIYFILFQTQRIQRPPKQPP